ncbi:type II toxin-antitoxin system CcdA family antitoxin [Pseudomonas alliivorans]|uniref:type II toxin-antitoxin system CcdA family antitoxin n=1 Tax=Pseudomonas alliivorans TaxID=2810613 RepID=UPI001F23B0B9|nr:type II toxin-antitoxin system CcdA family antitoxin [Pseudomonas alliivorans]MEE4879978.1 type II toxin-antitoxin system CcdA family antitoxin [Pseudomonas alliivorans]MEE4930874.1 type II toxin-antitoxin system CcdA family antitoxin [Pseudomonas alliivorans]MEE4936148.1 type II toxin-antitoxin system CcdA family antitoxin [Pseudomonas alliivorans]MEE4940700.1 type II toxin-antitoxin system CcdA family antitoxin [Pseudomonas alliivorans]MEE4951785.1 type II toxin-antitoxin system CcdA fami
MNSDDQPADEDNAENVKQREQWLEENRNAIQAYNRRFEEHECFSEGLRSF